MSKDFNLLHEKCVEPERRMFEGKYGWAVHTYAIKNGISRLDALRASINAISPTETPYMRYVKSVKVD